MSELLRSRHTLSLWQIIGRLFWSAGLMSMAGLAGGLVPQLGILSQLRLVWFWVLAAGVVFFLSQRQFRNALMIGLFFLVNLAPILPFLIIFRPVPIDIVTSYKAGPQKPSFRILQWNTWGGNRDAQGIIRVIHDSHADLAALEELSASNYEILRQSLALSNYKQRVWFPAGRLLLLSRFPIDSAKTRTASDPDRIEARIMIPGRPCRMIVTQTKRPLMNNTTYQLQLNTLKEQIRPVTLQSDHTDPVILAGDLNTSPWSSALQKLLNEAGLTNTQHGYMIAPTYPAQIPKTSIPWPLPFLPIDHVLISGPFSVSDRHNGQPGGSDHLPVIVDLRF